MSNPPPPGQWPPHPPPPGPSPFPPQPWGTQPPAPQGTGRSAKWILGGLALLTVIVLTVAATLLFARGGSEPFSPPIAPPTSSVDTARIASADDDGPVAIITEDPTCAAWTPIGDTLAQQQSQGWSDRDPKIPAAEWRPEQRAQHEGVAQAMRAAADQTAVIAAKTPHRLMRELYEQTIAYWRAYAERVPVYQPADDHLARVATSTSNALVWICSAIAYGAAEARSPFVIEAPAPLPLAPIGDTSRPSPFLSKPVGVCSEWHSTVAAFEVTISEWLSIDPELSAGQWSPEQLAVYTDVAPDMESNAGKLQDMGIRSDNPIFEDFATMAAQYRRAYVSAIPTYRPSDNFLASVASQLVAALDEACRASER